MKPEDIKIGETYTVRVKIRKIGETYIDCSPILEGGVLSNHWPTAFVVGELSAFSPIPTENGRNNSEPAPKYDPNRLFRKGDKVRVVKCNGRSPAMPFSDYKEGDICIVMKDEDETSYFVRVESSDKCGRDFLFCCLELITPVEELERYAVEPSDVAWFVVDTKHKAGTLNAVMFINAIHPNARAAAEAECARLNAEFRKEQSHE
jgi:hypothetical protein